MPNRTALALAALVLPFTLPTTAAGSDLVRLGSSARAIGMGNVAGMADDAVTALSTNPAFFSGLDKGMQLSLQTFLVDAKFTSSIGERDKADSGPGIVPDFAFVLPLENSRVTLGGGVHVESAMVASFDFTDPPGTLGVTYGHQTHESQFTVVNSSIAAAWAWNDHLSLGAQFGFSYNRNQLKAPYIFQSHPALQSLKVLVDLDVNDFSPTFALGFDYKGEDNTRVYASWHRKTKFDASGDTSGNLGQLGLGIQETFTYDTVVNTAMPGYLTAGVAWPAGDGLTLGVQLDWIQWDSAFAELPILLTNGSNNDLNTFLGSTSIADTAPLAWDDQLTLHLGAQWQRGDRQYRAGYEYSDVPVPTATMTPMTGAILEHALSAGVSLPFNGSILDLSYRVSFSGGDRTIVASGLQGGEYTGSSLDLVLHSVGVAFRF